MPIYDFYCPVCGHREIDIKRNVEDIKVFKCKVCDNFMKVSISPPLLNFRGDGWAKDGYSNNKTKGEKNETTATPTS